MQLRAVVYLIQVTHFVVKFNLTKHTLALIKKEHHVVSTQSLILRIGQITKFILLLVFSLSASSVVAQAAQTEYVEHFFFPSGTLTSTDPQVMCDSQIDELNAYIRLRKPYYYPLITRAVVGYAGYPNSSYYCDYSDPSMLSVLIPEEISQTYFSFMGVQACPKGQTLVAQYLQQNMLYQFGCRAPTLLGFFNGVANSEEEANKSLDKIQEEFRDTPERPIEHELFYNQTACKKNAEGIDVSCLEDIAETFAQRNTEQGGVLANKWEIFWEVLAGRHQVTDSLTNTLLSRLGSAGAALADLIGSIFNSIVSNAANLFTKTLTLLSSPPTAADSAKHLAKLQGYATNGSSMVLVAHSQGNLFVNVAYNGIKASHPNVKIEVVHVAPASITMSPGKNGVNDYGLADIDLVINALRLTGGAPANNIPMPPSEKDKTGHGFVDTYMDKTRAAYTYVHGLITATLATVSN